MWLLKIKKKKIQFLIITLLSMMASAILTACIAFTLETGHFVKDYYSVEKSPMIYAVSTRDDCRELVAADADASKVFTQVLTGHAKYMTDSFYLNDTKIANEGNFVFGIADIRQAGYDLKISRGEEKSSPGDNEIWISHIFADIHHMQIGDSFRIGKENAYTISAIVNSPLSSSGFIDTYPFYINEDALSQIDEPVCYSVMLYANNDSLSTKEMEDLLPKEALNSLIFRLEKSTLELCLSVLSGIFGGVGIAAALIIILVTMIIFRYLVRATISKEYQMIGIYKAIGKDNSEIKKIYLTAYLISGFAGMLIGYFLARPLTEYLSGTVLGFIKSFHLTGYTSLTGVLVILFMSITILLNLWVELQKVHSVSPVQAINYHKFSTSDKLCKPIIPNAHSALSAAINGIFRRRGMSLLIILILTVSIYIELLSCSVSLTMSNYANDKQIWGNLPSYDCVIKTNDCPESLSYVKASQDVRDYSQVMLDPVCSGMEIEGTNWASDQTHPMIYDEFQEINYKDVPFKKGRICLEPGEIAASVSFLKEVGKKAGDYIEIKNGDLSRNFLIIGSYSAMIKGGVSFYMQESDFNDLGYESNFSTILVFLNEGVTYESFAEDFEEHVPSGSIYPEFGFLEKEGQTVADIADPVCAVLFVALAAFSILNMVNLVHTQNKENRRKYGIMKALGFTSGYIFCESIFQLTLEYGVAVLLTLLLHEWLSPIVFSLASSVSFIHKPLWLSAIVCLGTYAVLMTIVAFMLLPVWKIKPVELMEE